MVFIVIISFFTFYQIRELELKETISVLAPLKTKEPTLKIIKDCFYYLNKAEKDFSSYTKTSESKHLINYLKEIDSIKQKLDTLKFSIKSDSQKDQTTYSIQDQKEILFNINRLNEISDSIIKNAASFNFSPGNYSNFRLSQLIIKNRNNISATEEKLLILNNYELSCELRRIINTLNYSIHRNNNKFQDAAVLKIGITKDYFNRIIFVCIGITIFLIFSIIIVFRQINRYERVNKKKLILHLKENEEKYRNLIESATDSIFIIKDGIIVFVNQVLLKMSGYTEKEIIGMPFIHFVGSKYRSIIMEYYQKRLKGEDAPFSYESYALLKDNTEFPVEVTTSVFNYHGERAELVFLRDIRERKAAEIKILESKNSFENLFENSPVSIWEEDITKVIQEINDLKQEGVIDFEDYFRKKPEQLVHFLSLIKILRINKETLALYNASTKKEILNNIHETFLPESFEVFKSELISLASGQTKMESQTKVKSLDGKVLDVIIKMFTLRTDERQIAYVTTIDISKLSAAEAEIRKLNNELEKRVSERTAQLETVNKDLESFAYSISHDLRAPLRHIDGFFRMLNKSIPNQTSDIEYYFQKINESTGKMAKMIDDLLNFSRLGRKNINKSEVDLNILAARVIDQFKPDIGSRSVVWKIDKLPVIQGDSDLLQLAFTNLISNSLKFTSKNPKAIIVIGNCEIKGKHGFFIKDNGVGFDMQYSDKLFGVFQRLHTSDEFEGNGIGLANIQQIIHKHGGTISAYGEKNNGATFFIYF